MKSRFREAERISLSSPLRETGAQLVSVPGLPAKRSDAQCWFATFIGRNGWKLQETQGASEDDVLASMVRTVQAGSQGLGRG